MYTYRDYIGDKYPYTIKIRKTKGKFTGFTKPTRAIVKYATFRNRCSEILVPVPLLTQETMRRIVKIEVARKKVKSNKG